ncbi:MAG: hypothetical protein ACYDC3_01610 [Candidatus Binataceae bacterium]
MKLIQKLRYMAGLVLISIVLMGSATAPATLATVSIPPVTLAANERIVGVDCIIRPARVTAIRGVPARWRASVTNAAQGFAAVSAQATQSSAGFASGAPDFFADFITIEKSRIPRPIQIRVTIKIGSLGNPAKFRYITYVLKDLKITPIAGAPPVTKQ